MVAFDIEIGVDFSMCELANRKGDHRDNQINVK